jgi:hypothetical protein
LNALSDSPDSSHGLLDVYSGHVGYCSDKWESILKRYTALFAPMKDQPVRLLEVGVQNGGSLEIWARYFPAALRITGCDIEPRCASLQFADPRIRLVIGDAGKAETRALLESASAAYDVIIDDGSHRSSDIAGTFCSLFPLLADGGLYVIEDLHCSYWREFQGGLFAPHSAMAFLKKLCDVVNHEHWGLAANSGVVFEGPFGELGAAISQEQLAHIHSLEFANSLCIIRKEALSENVLGARIIAGREAPVLPALLTFSGKSVPPPDQTSSEWSRPAELPSAAQNEDEISPLRERIRKEEAAALQDEIRRLHADNAWLAEELAAIKRLWSWRLSAPFRNLWRFPGRLRRQLRRKFTS